MEPEIGRGGTPTEAFPPGHGCFVGPWCLALRRRDKIGKLLGGQVMAGRRALLVRRVGKQASQPRGSVTDRRFLGPTILVKSRVALCGCGGLFDVVSVSV
jgi:hypothetical protein